MGWGGAVGMNMLQPAGHGLPSPSPCGTLDPFGTSPNSSPYLTFGYCNPHPGSVTGLL